MPLQLAPFPTTSQYGSREVGAPAQASPVDELLSLMQPELDKIRARQQEYLDLMQPRAPVV